MATDDIFADDKGNKSMMRGMCFIALLAAIMFGLLAVQLDSDKGVWITGAFIAAAFAPKALQKYIEARA